MINTIRNLPNTKIKLILPLVWLPISIFTSLFVIGFLIVNISFANNVDLNLYSTFAAKPKVLGATDSGLYGEDARAKRLNEVFKYYKCPIEGKGEIFVQKADEYNIPYWLVASVAFQESSCGKNIATKDGKSSNNLWGWGIYGDNVHTFENIDQGIDTVSKYMAKNFYDKGINDLCVIMKTYTPPSDGSWCRGVGFFRDQIID